MTTYYESSYVTQVNTQTTGFQSFPAITGLPGGGYVMAWYTGDTAQDGSGLAIKAQAFNAAGQPLGGEVLVNTLANGDQSMPSITALNNGGYVISWESYDSTVGGATAYSIRAQAFTAAGAKSGAEIVVSTQTGSPVYAPTMTTLANGNYVVAFQTYQSPVFANGPEIKAQIFTPAGTKVGSEFYVNTNTASVQANPAIADLTGGGFVVTWQLGNSPGNDVYAQVFAADGSKVGGEFLVNTNTTGNQWDPQVTGLANGGFAITWTTTDTAADGSGQAIKGQVFNAAGTKVGTEFLVNTTAADSQAGSSIASLADGTFIVSWGLQNNIAATSVSRAQIFDVNGAKVGVELALVNDVNASELVSAIAALDTGGFVFGFGRYAGAAIDVGVAVFAVNPPPVITSNGGGTAATVNVAEGTAAVTTVTASDAGGPNTITYSIVGGADAARFAIDAQSGALSFIASPNYEAPTDAGGDNTYQVIVRASDGLEGSTQTLAVSVTDVNEVPAFVSPAAFASSENSTAVGIVAAGDPDGTSVNYVITGGADAALFAIDALTGALSFVTAPNFEVPGDGDGDNVYQIEIAASDGVNSITQSVAVTVANADEAPTITSSAAFGAQENQLAVGQVIGSDPEGSALGYQIVGGADAARFAINSLTGLLSFTTSPDYEAPGDADLDNVYQLTVGAWDGAQWTTQAVSVTVGNVNEAPVLLASGGDDNNLVVAEGQTSVVTLLATDPEGTDPGYAIIGGADAALFTIDAVTGALSFVSAPDFEAPGDADGNNVYDLVVAASDGQLADTRTIAVSVTNANEAPQITSNGGGASVSLSLTENAIAVTTVTSSDPDGQPRSYAIVGGADAARFAIDAVTGALSFLTAPNFEAPTDANGDNIYDVIVEASDGTLADSQALAVIVTNVNEAPVIVSGGGGASAAYTVNENSAAVATLSAADPDGTGVTYSIVGGADAARFVINAATGALSFVAAPNFEAPTDAGANNVYDLIVQASDGNLIDLQSLSVTVANVVDGVTRTGTSKAETLTGTTAEDTLNGLGGNDVLNGGLGRDVLTGGAGNDTFVFASLADSLVSNPDLITDFGTGADKINLTGIDANANTAGDQAFAWIGTASFSNVAGQLRTYQAGGDTFVTGDVNGDGVGDFLIQIDPLVSLTSSSFLL